MSRIILLGATSIVIGILWDISWHRTIGRDTFWTPAHLAIQIGGLLGGLTAGWLAVRTTFFGTPAEKAVRCWALGFPRAARGLGDHLGLPGDADLGSFRQLVA